MPVVEDVSLDELKRGLADGSIALVDVREPNEWEAGHIAGATLHPLSLFRSVRIAARRRKARRAAMPLRQTLCESFGNRASERP